MVNQIILFFLFTEIPIREREMNRFVFNEPNKSFSTKSQIEENKNTVTPL